MTKTVAFQKKKIIIFSFKWPTLLLCRLVLTGKQKQIEHEIHVWTERRAKKKNYKRK